MDFNVMTIVAFIVGVILPVIFTQILPNRLFHGWGFSVGKKLSSLGRRWVTTDAWESVENNMTGSFFSFAQGLKEGADSDDPA